ncbi:unnamed protein product [Arabis nemorensis]|uniref:Uncharacterized protein n=1 Tax=Arabis nemorensis TaxID=586526 RepID=A0A565BAL3_9BRAS|nr:unnamed protein product [Arabis nemorensis]
MRCFLTGAFNSLVESTEKSCRDTYMEDLASTTRYVIWSLHNKNRAGLRQLLDSFGGTEHLATSGNPIDSSLPQDAPSGATDTKSRSDVKLSHLASNTDSGSSIQTTENAAVGWSSR